MRHTPPKETATAPATATEAELEWLLSDEAKALARKELALHGILFESKSGKEYELRGANKDFVTSTEPQVVIAGVSDSGKSVASCLKMHSTCLQYGGTQGAIVRKVLGTIFGSILQTFYRIAGDAVTSFGGEKPQWLDYANGSRIWVGGMDNPNNVLSSERDFIYVNQAEELSQNDWETLSTRTTGRNAVVPHAQLLGDCNPAGSKHWIRELAKSGTVRLLTATHKDNPTIYNADGSLTASGAARLDALSKLTGLRRKRLFEGIWATAEGAVYENFDASIHVFRRDVSEFKRFFLCQDEGFTNPAVILLVGEDSDGRRHVLREFYQTGQLEESVVRQAKTWYDEFKCELDAVDASAAGLIAALRAVHINAQGGKGYVEDGCNKIRDRLKVQADGRPRLSFDPSCVNCQNEFESYVFKPGSDVPMKENDHTSDGLRYLEDVVEKQFELWIA